MISMDSDKTIKLFLVVEMGRIFCPAVKSPYIPCWPMQLYNEIAITPLSC
jgi:hypothetical protein